MRLLVNCHHYQIDIDFAAGVRKGTVTAREIDILVQAGAQIFMRVETLSNQNQIYHPQGNDTSPCREEKGVTK